MNNEPQSPLKNINTDIQHYRHKWEALTIFNAGSPVSPLLSTAFTLEIRHTPTKNWKVHESLLVCLSCSEQVTSVGICLPKIMVFTMKYPTNYGDPTWSSILQNTIAPAHPQIPSRPLWNEKCKKFKKNILLRSLGQTVSSTSSWR